MRCAIRPWTLCETTAARLRPLTPMRTQAVHGASTASSESDERRPAGPSSHPSAHDSDLSRPCRPCPLLVPLDAALNMALPVSVAARLFASSAPNPSRSSMLATGPCYRLLSCARLLRSLPHKCCSGSVRLGLLLWPCTWTLPTPGRRACWLSEESTVAPTHSHHRSLRALLALLHTLAYPPLSICAVANLSHHPPLSTYPTASLLHPSPYPLRPSSLPAQTPM
jgi:hypothetical protein